MINQQNVLHYILSLQNKLQTIERNIQVVDSIKRDLIDAQQTLTHIIPTLARTLEPTNTRYTTSSRSLTSNTITLDEEDDSSVEVVGFTQAPCDPRRYASAPSIPSTIATVAQPPIVAASIYQSTSVPHEQPNQEDKKPSASQAVVSAPEVALLQHAPTPSQTVATTKPKETKAEIHRKRQIGIAKCKSYPFAKEAEKERRRQVAFDKRFRAWKNGINNSSRRKGETSEEESLPSWRRASRFT
jgi:hypothetical protein